ncbi:MULTISPECIES: NCS1 family transporter [Lentilactobacillus]|uniref:Putative allantoin permease n=3 Tax=Lentilactobacillus parabuchneri TaxID=152331 RepID=A0A1X1FEL2_9LACO|nr:NCS1 family transporter [Lentilactobacillus parabuchneri]APR07522.1 putative allantoin permease [Lentilactobacillus parabuchneri]MBW0264127.1 NCS1 family transporter [Lentilactobacillus parabuchneri]MCW4399417.1 NCS1 family transporter [Lentilactobacillus parabuchneri]MDB1103830.1 NCS1 family transporter [Lentilactobacillus parabuchneri]MDN6434472.1 NCS1 family transporter [Lentilactobacillus parabuchneri]
MNSSHSLSVPADLKPRTKNQRHVGELSYMAMWLGDGFNIGNVTLGSSIVVAGTASMNLLQTMVAAALAISIISIIFVLNDHFGYYTGSPYVIQLRMTFGLLGSKLASLLRGIPAIVWYGFQSWTGALALNQIAKILTGYDNVPVFFVTLLAIQTLLSVNGFKSIKVVSIWISLLMSIALISTLAYLISQKSAVFIARMVNVKGTWGPTFWGFVVAFLGNYTAIFESAADYSRELKPGLSNRRRAALYFFPIFLAYGMTLLTGSLLAVVTGISSPVHAMAHLFNNNVITVVVSIFIVLGTMSTNLVANIIPPTYVLNDWFNISERQSLVVVAFLACLSFPWLLVQDSSSMGLTIFIKTYSAFLGPMTAIVLNEYYIKRRKKVDVEALYQDDKVSPSLPPVIALFAGATLALANVNLSWPIGFAVSWLVLILLRYDK